VLLDSVDGHADVEEVMDTRAADGGETRRYVCRTPCIVDLPYGPHLLRAGTDTFDVQVGEKPRVVRFAVTDVHEHPWGLFAGNTALLFGFLAVVGGGTFWMLSTGRDPVVSERAGKAGQYTAIGGGLGMVAGLTIAWGSRTEIRPGVNQQITSTEAGVFKF